MNYKLTSIPQTTVRVTNVLKNDSDKETYILQGLSEDEKTKVKELAETATQMLPTDKSTQWNCFYYADTNELQGFIAPISKQSTSGGGGSGYQMRADPNGEADYKWKIATLPIDENNAKLLSYLFDLEKNNGLTVTTSPYPETNWPKDKTGGVHLGIKNGTSGMESWFNYYKKSKDLTSTRNTPLKPAKPRVYNQGDQKTTFKLDKKSYRVLEKIEQSIRTLITWYTNP